MIASVEEADPDYEWEDIAAALSHLRVSRIAWNDDAVTMLLRLFERLGTAADFMALLSVLTAVLENATGAADVNAALAHRKRTYFRALNAAERINITVHSYR